MKINKNLYFTGSFSPIINVPTWGVCGSGSSKGQTLFKIQRNQWGSRKWYPPWIGDAQVWANMIRHWLFSRVSHLPVLQTTVFSTLGSEKSLSDCKKVSQPLRISSKLMTFIWKAMVSMRMFWWHFVALFLQRWKFEWFSLRKWKTLLPFFLFL